MSGDKLTVVHLLAIWQVTEPGQSGLARQFGGLALVLLWDVGRRHMRVLEQMAMHLPVHVYIQRYMHMARDCAAPPTHSEYNLMGGGRNPASRPIPRPLFWCGSLMEPMLDT